MAAMIFKYLTGGGRFSFSLSHGEIFFVQIVSWIKRGVQQKMDLNDSNEFEDRG